MGEGHFQNEWRAIVLYYAPQFENVPAFGLYSTLLSLDLGSTKILFFPIFFSFFPLSLGVTYNTFFFFFFGGGLMTNPPFLFSRSLFFFLFPLLIMGFFPPFFFFFLGVGLDDYHTMSISPVPCLCDPLPKRSQKK